MFKHECEMYPLVKDFLIKKQECNEEKTGYTSEKKCLTDEGKTLSLALFGRSIEPDVYGIDDTKGIIYLAEGKITHEGRSFDEAIVQGVTYQRFSHYVYVFFPIIEDADILKHLKELCEEYGLGLLLIDYQRQVEEIVTPKLSKFYGGNNWSITRDNIKTAEEKITRLLLLGGVGKIGQVHLPILRDICYLLGEKVSWNNEETFIIFLRKHTLLDKYRSQGLNGKESSLNLHDGSVKNPLLLKKIKSRNNSSRGATVEEVSDTFKKLITETLNTLEYLGLLKRDKESMNLTPQGINFRNVIRGDNKQNLYRKEVVDTIQRTFISILLAKEEVEEEIRKMCEIIKSVEPQPRFRFWCDKCDYKKDWTVKKLEKEKLLNIYKKYGEIHCPICNNKKVPQPYNLLMAAKDLENTYRLEVLLEETKIIEKARSFDQLPPEMKRKFRINDPKRTTYWYLGKNAPYLSE
ncbi:hypothetical protein BMS3Abin16_01537 [archaeon BMS3Abin16]|nr:hypothetical protein BMS3Abin16_01537 [archaeon BMS3Abin16]